MPQYVSSDNYAAIERQYGAEEAARLAKQYGWQITLPESEFTPISATGGLGGGTKVEDDDYQGNTATDETVDVAPSTGPLDAPVSYSAYQAAQKRVDDQIKANIDLLTAGRDALRNRRVGPSDSEKWFAIAAALGKPTRTGAFGESLGNLNEALATQNAARRKEREAQEALLEKYGLQIGSEQLRMLTSAANQAGQTYRTEAAAAAAARKAGMPKPVVDIGGVPSDPITGQPIEAPSEKAYADLTANPTPENYRAMVKAYPRFAEKFKLAYDRGLAKIGGVR